MNVTKSIYKKMLSEYPDVLSVKEMRLALGNISLSTCYDLLINNKIPSIKCGREYRITKLCLLEYLLNANKNLNIPK